jgi:hypothetical protein
MDGESGNLVVTVPAGIEKHLVLPVLLGVQYVVAACMHPLKKAENLFMSQSPLGKNNQERSKLAEHMNQSPSISSPFPAELHGAHGCSCCALSALSCSALTVSVIRDG